MDSLTLYRGREEGLDSEIRPPTHPVYNNQDMMITAITEAGLPYSAPCQASTSGFTDGSSTYDAGVIARIQADINVINNKISDIKNRPITIVATDVINNLYSTNKLLSSRQSMYDTTQRILEQRVNLLEQRYPVVYQQAAPTISNKNPPYNKS